MIPLHKLKDIRRYAPKEQLRTREAKRLVRRSYIVGYGRPAAAGVIAILLTGTVAAYIDTVAVWDLSRELRAQQGAVRVAPIQTSSRDVVMTFDRNTMVLWNAKTLESASYEGEGVAFSYPYAVLKQVIPRGADLYVEFISVNVETGRKTILEIDGNISPNFKVRADGDLFLVFGKDYYATASQRLFVADLETGKLVAQIDHSFETESEAYVIDRDRILLSSGKGDVGEIWGVSQARVLGQLKRETDRWVRMLALGADQVTKRAISIQEMRDLEPVIDDPMEAGKNFPREGSQFSICIWGLTGATPRVLFEAPINFDDAQSQFNAGDDRSPEKGIDYKTNVAVFPSDVWLAIALDGSSGEAEYLFNSNLTLLDSAVADQPRGVMRSIERYFLYFAKSNKSLSLWDVRAGRNVSLLNFSANFGDRFNIDQKGAALLAERANSKFELWQLEGGTSPVSFQATN